MRVSELIAVLRELDPTMDVLAHAKHGDCRFQFFEIEKVDRVSAKRARDDTFDHEQGRPLAVLTLTSDF